MTYEWCQETWRRLVRQIYNPPSYALNEKTLRRRPIIKTKINHNIRKINLCRNSWWTDTMSTSITTDVSNYGAQGYGDLSHSMKALTWQGKNSVKVGQSCCPSQPSYQSLEIIRLFFLYSLLVETARPTIIDEGDVILKVTGSTICGSDLHLFHGM